MLTYIAYILARKLEGSDKFPCGTDKIGTLAGYTSSLFLGFTGMWIIYEAIFRLISPQNIVFKEAIIIAIIGFIVNGFCIFIMEYKEHRHECEAEHKDYNFISAYYHILADAFTSILAILALIIGKYFDILCLDSIVGILGGILILKWSISLLKDTTKILVDCK